MVVMDPDPRASASAASESDLHKSCPPQAGSWAWFCRPVGPNTVRQPNTILPSYHKLLQLTSVTSLLKATADRLQQETFLKQARTK